MIWESRFVHASRPSLLKFTRTTGSPSRARQKDCQGPRKFRNDKRVHLGALEYVPHAVIKLLENLGSKFAKCQSYTTLLVPSRLLTKFRASLSRYTMPNGVQCGWRCEGRRDTVDTSSVCDSLLLMMKSLLWTMAIMSSMLNLWKLSNSNSTKRRMRPSLIGFMTQSPSWICQPLMDLRRPRAFS